ncbi:hypothetical protein BaRGS_00033992 [Batillaria attramentaria]|uniref:Uncharacterized protein n=1 Tax=Batillaria attramentaria TaxID=370345 RepID=A0ABD0JJF5_9CAEN
MYGHDPIALVADIQCDYQHNTERVVWRENCEGRLHSMEAVPHPGPFERHNCNFPQGPDKNRNELKHTNEVKRMVFFSTGSPPQEICAAVGTREGELTP